MDKSGRGKLIISPPASVHSSVEPMMLETCLYVHKCVYTIGRELEILKGAGF